MVSKAELAKHTSRDDCWVAIHGKVYDVTQFLSMHPGGVGTLLKVPNASLCVCLRIRIRCFVEHVCYRRQARTAPNSLCGWVTNLLLLEGSRHQKFTILKPASLRDMIELKKDVC